MPMTIEHEGGNVYRLEIRGMLRKADFDRSQEALAGEMDRVGPVRLLVILTGFEAWEAGSDWSDLSFYLKHGDRIDRIAIVGADRWRDEALMFAAAGLRRAPVEYFGQEADARRWLAA